jgi:hypothetical protein
VTLRTCGFDDHNDFIEQVAARPDRDPLTPAMSPSEDEHNCVLDPYLPKSAASHLTVRICGPADLGSPSGSGEADAAVTVFDTRSGPTRVERCEAPPEASHKA